jgi:hypothetical protein
LDSLSALPETAIGLPPDAGGIELGQSSAQPSADAEVSGRYTGGTTSTLSVLSQEESLLLVSWPHDVPLARTANIGAKAAAAIAVARTSRRLFSPRDVIRLPEQIFAQFLAGIVARLSFSSANQQPTSQAFSPSDPYRD